MRRYRVPADLRGKLFGEPDPRLQRALRASAIAGAVIGLGLMLMPARRMELKPQRILPSQRQARVIAPEKPKPRQVTTPAPTPKPKPVEPAESAPSRPTEQVARSAPRPTSEPPRAQPGPPRGQQAARRGQPAAPRDPNAGRKGSDAAERATETLRSTASSIDNLLASVNGAVPTGGVGSTTPGGAIAQKYAIRGGRRAEELSSLDGALVAQGAGKGGGGTHGIEKSGVDIVDSGVQSSGDGAQLSGRDSASLMAVVQRYKSGVKFCYDNALKNAPNLSGKITLQLDIAASGRVEKLVVISDSLGDQALQRCIKAQVQSWRFPAIEAGTVRFTLPLVFSPPEA